MFKFTPSGDDGLPSVKVTVGRGRRGKWGRCTAGIRPESPVPGWPGLKGALDLIPVSEDSPDPLLDGLVGFGSVFEAQGSEDDDLNLLKTGTGFMQ